MSENSNITFVTDLYVSLSVACGESGNIGFLGIDLYFSSLVEDITYYSQYEQYSYAFLTTLNGEGKLY